MESEPPTAKEIYAIPRCHELAERLSRSAQSIDPSIRGLLIRGIEMNNDGSGVVVFRVPESAVAPHRALDLNAYIRRNANLIRVAKTIDNVRFLGGLPDHEYSVEIELSRNGMSRGTLAIQDWNYPFGDGHWELAGQLTLPRLIFGPLSELGVFLTQAHTDIFDACGANRHEPIQIKVVDFG